MNTSNLIQQQFQDACDVIHRPKLAKLINPGLHKLCRRVAARSGWLGGRIPTRLFFGESMTVVLPEVTSEALYTYGMFDETVTWMALQTVRPGQTILDVGAHFGYFSLLFAHMVGPSGRVLAFEPTPSTFDILSENVRHHPNIEPINSAAGDKPGVTEITDFGVTYSAWNTLASESRLGGVPSGAKAEQRLINVARLDETCKTKGVQPGFVKIDAENFEDHVIAGLAGLFTAHRPAILMETGSGQGLAAAHRLLGYGYRPRVSDGPGTLYDWNADIAEANARFKDILFVDAAAP